MLFTKYFSFTSLFSKAPPGAFSTDPMDISIITVCLNRDETIEDTVRSTLGHDYGYIVVGGGSTDGTLDILIKYRGRISRRISEPDNSVYEAMNK